LPHDSLSELALNKDNISSLATNIAKNYIEFKKDEFLDSILPNLKKLKIKERSTIVCNSLTKFLPNDFVKSSLIIKHSLGSEIKTENAGDYSSFIMLPINEYVAKNGLEYFTLSMELLYDITKRFTSEFGIRDFLIKYEEQTLNQLILWARDENYHIRRLVSEGSRPRLPWAKQIPSFIQNPTPVLELLENLLHSKERYVERSIANNLNDISKDNPKILLNSMKIWDNKKILAPYIKRHALRTLLKKGDKEALEFLGYKQDLTLEIKLMVNRSVNIGDSLNIGLELLSKKEQLLMVDLVVEYKKANGKIRYKVFKWLNKTIQNKIDASKTISFKQLSTRKHYEGKHTISLQINGVLYEKKEFLLLP
jgi:3-methyladenine DNA glycosylase AlkC